MSEETDGYSKLYDRLRAQVEHENELYNQRIIWLITMQAFLYATIGLLIQARINLDPNAWYLQIDGFAALVCVLGALVALVADRLLGNARSALAHIRALWDSAIERLPDRDRMYFPHVAGGDGKAGSASLLRSGNLPKIFALSWVLAASLLFHSHMWTVFIYWQSRLTA